MTDGKGKAARRRSQSKRGRGKRARARSCGTKRAFTETSAWDEAHRLRRATGTPMKAYRREHCSLPDGSRAWHVGHVVSRWRRQGG